MEKNFKVGKAWITKSAELGNAEAFQLLSTHF